MEADRLFNILKKLDIPVTNTAFPPNKVVYAPFCIFVRSDIENFNADNVNYFNQEKYRIELYSIERRIDLENELTKLLENEEITWSFLYDEMTPEGLYITAIEV